MGQFGQRAKDTYWYVMREEMFKSVDPLIMRVFYESEFYPDKEPSIQYEDIGVDFEKIKSHKSLRKAISRALSLRVWHKNLLIETREKINDVIFVLDND